MPLMHSPFSSVQGDIVRISTLAVLKLEVVFETPSPLGMHECGNTEQGLWEC
jgi:hypothetical protein